LFFAVPFPFRRKARSKKVQTFQRKRAKKAFEKGFASSVRKVWKEREAAKRQVKLWLCYDDIVPKWYCLLMRFFSIYFISKLVLAA
jgi:uncharacterized membrane protein YkvA (DUF1232 family)